MEHIAVTIIPIIKNNYSYIVKDLYSDITAAIDVGDSSPVLHYLSNNKLSLDYILSTHNHWDHTSGNIELKKTTGSKVMGPDKGIPGIDFIISESSKLSLGKTKCNILSLPGHTENHVAFLFGDCLFCGDVLFVGGCGKVMNNRMGDMYNSIQKLQKLDDKTKIYCGHEYTLANLEFALKVEPDNLYAYNMLKDLKANPIITVPSTIEKEKLINPYFRLEIIKEKLRRKNENNLSIFETIRRMKDEYTQSKII